MKFYEILILELTRNKNFFLSILIKKMSLSFVI